MMEFFSGKYHVARKEHTCEACQQKIQVGEKYEYESGKFDGMFFDRHYHIDCYMTLQDFFSDALYDDTFTYDQVYDWWLEGYCYQCVCWSENGGKCDADMDRHIWCTKFKKKERSDRVTTDEVKDYLRQAYKLDRRLQRERRKLEQLESKVRYVSPSFEGMGGHGSGDKMSTAVADIIERTQRVQELTATYTARYGEIEQAIHSLHDDVLEEVLELRYLQYMKWDKIAERMNYTERRVLQLHGNALKKISLYFSI